jgi:hypothetical protein
MPAYSYEDYVKDMENDNAPTEGYGGISDFVASIAVDRLIGIAKKQIGDRIDTPAEREAVAKVAADAAAAFVREKVLQALEAAAKALEA